MATTNDGRSETPARANSASPEALPREAMLATRALVGPAAPADQGTQPDQPAVAPPTPPPAHPEFPVWRKWLRWAGIVVGLAIGSYFLVPWIITVLNTVSTDDAYVNGHVTFVAPRVAGQVKKVLVDDNYRVKKGDILVELDKEPYQVQVDIKKAAVVNGPDRDLMAAKAQVRGLVAQTRANRFKLDHAIE